MVSTRLVPTTDKGSLPFLFFLDELPFERWRSAHRFPICNAELRWSISMAFYSVASFIDGKSPANRIQPASCAVRLDDDVAWPATMRPDNAIATHGLDTWACPIATMGDDSITATGLTWFVCVARAAEQGWH